MTINFFTYVGVFAVSYWFVFKLLHQLEGKR